MTSSDSTYPGPWDTRASFSPSHFEGPDNTHQAYNHFRADQIYPPVEQVEDSTGSGSAADFSQFTSDAHSYSSSIACEPTFSFHHSPQSVVFNESTTFQPHHFEGLEQTDVKSTPRIDVLVENIGYQHESISSSPSWNASPSSASTDATSPYYSPLYSNTNRYYDSGSPQSSTLSDFPGFFINGHPCRYLAASENDDGRHLSEQTTFREFRHDPTGVSTSCTISPEILEPKHEEDALYSFDLHVASSCCPEYMPPKKISPEISEPKHEEDPLYPFDLHVAASRCPEYMPPKKTVASPKVLAASRRRRGPSKQGTRLHKCPHCCETFTARHNLTNHINSHSGYRPYRCDACGLSFGTKHVLKRHQKTCQMHASTSLTHYVN